MERCLACQTDNPANQRFCGQCRTYLGAVGAYRLAQKLGVGGFASVYQGIDQETQFPVAIKLLHQELHHNASLIKRFQREADLLKQLTHPHVVRVFDFGKIEDLGLYLVMEWLNGYTLEEWILDHRRAALQWSAVLPILTQLLQGLSYIHKQGVIHRDLKPSNLMLVDEKGLEVLKILDFGIAKMDAVEQLTQGPGAMGTPHFMAPELIQGQQDEIGPATDLYAVGIIMSWMLTGEYIFSGNTTHEVLQKHCHETPPSLSQMRPDLAFPRQLEALVQKTLAKQAKDRFASAQELLQALSVTTEDATIQIFHGQSLPSSDTLTRPHDAPPTQPSTPENRSPDAFGETFEAAPDKPKSPAHNSDGSAAHDKLAAHSSAPLSGVSSLTPPDTAHTPVSPKVADTEIASTPASDKKPPKEGKLSVQVGGVSAGVDFSMDDSSLKVGLGFGPKFRLFFQIAFGFMIVSTSGLLYYKTMDMASDRKTIQMDQIAPTLTNEGTQQIPLAARWTGAPQKPLARPRPSPITKRPVIAIAPPVARRPAPTRRPATTGWPAIARILSRVPAMTEPPPILWQRAPYVAMPPPPSIPPSIPPLRPMDNDQPTPTTDLQPRTNKRPKQRKRYKKQRKRVSATGGFQIAKIKIMTKAKEAPTGKEDDRSLMGSVNNTETKPRTQSTTTGEIALQKQLRQKLSRDQAQLTSCLQQYPMQAQQKGHITFHLVLHKSGSVTAVTLTPARYKALPALRCMRQKLRAMRFRRFASPDSLVIKLPWHIPTTNKP